ncbi:MAG TPA: hypothetical protein VF681_08900 [Abditibacteriaceae bacterium]|jgi:hypothetical protein
MIVEVTREDIVRSGRSGGDNPIARALFRATGQAWVVFGGSMAYSRTSPHHALALPFEVHQYWRAWLWQPFSFEVQWLHPPVRAELERRARQRRASPRFGFDRRARDRRNRERRYRHRRSFNAPVSFTTLDRRTSPRRDSDAQGVAVEISPEQE